MCPFHFLFLLLSLLHANSMSTALLNLSHGHSYFLFWYFPLSQETLCILYSCNVPVTWPFYCISCPGTALVIWQFYFVLWYCTCYMPFCLLFWNYTCHVPIPVLVPCLPHTHFTSCSGIARDSLPFFFCTGTAHITWQHCFLLYMIITIPYTVGTISENSHAVW